MKRAFRLWIRITLGILTVLLLMSAALWIGLPLWSQSSKVKDLVCWKIQELTGWKASLSGLRIRWRGGVEILGEDLTLTAPSRGASSIGIPRFLARISIQDLLHGRISFQSVRLKGPQFVLSTPPIGGLKEGDTVGKALSLLEPFGSIEIEAARMLLGGPSGPMVAFQHVRLRPLPSEKALSFEGKGAVWRRTDRLARFRIMGTLEGAGQLRMAMDWEKMPLARLPLPPAAKDHSIRLEGDASGSLRVEGALGALKFTGKWKITRFSISWPGKLAVPFRTQLCSGEAKGQWSPTQWRISSFRVQAGRIQLDGSLQGKVSGIRGTLYGASFSFEQIIPYLGRELVGQDLFSFFRHNLKGGEGGRTTFTFQWRKNGGQREGRPLTLRMEMPFRKARLLFDPGLPPLEDLRGRLFWEGDRVWFRELEGTYKGRPFQRMQAEITEIGSTSRLKGLFLIQLKPFDLIELYSRLTGGDRGIRKIESLQGSCRLDLSLAKSFLLDEPLQYRALIHLKGIKGVIPGIHQTWEISKAQLSAEPGGVLISDLQGKFAGAEIFLEGALDMQESSHQELNLKGRARIPQPLMERVFDPLAPHLRIEAGAPTPLTFTIRGSRESPIFELHWDLTSVEMEVRGTWKKPARVPFRLYGMLQRTPDGSWHLVQGRLEQPWGNIEAEGWWGGGLKRKWIRFRAARIPIDELISHSPKLRSWVHGGRVKLEGEFHLAKQSHWLVSIHPEDVWLDARLLGHKAQIRSGNVILTTGWSQMDPLVLNLMGRDYLLWGRLRRKETGFTFRGRVEGERMDLDSWLFPRVPSGSPTSELTRLSSAPFQQWLNTFDSSEMEFRFSKVKMLDLEFEEAQGRLRVEKGKLNLLDSSARLAGGDVAVEGNLDAEGHFWLAGGVDGADTSAVLHALGFREELVEGNLFLQFGVQGRLRGRKAVRHSGNIEMEVDRGVIRKFPVLANILSILNVSQILTGRLPDLSREGMVFRKIRATFDLKDGVASTDNFRIHSEAMGITMVGDLDITTGQCDYKVGLHPFVGLDRVVSAIPVIRHYLAGKDRSVLGMYFLVQGPLRDPRVKPIPFRSLGEGLIGLFKRLLQNPFQDLGVTWDPTLPPPQEENTPP